MLVEGADYTTDRSLVSMLNASNQAVRVPVLLTNDGIYELTEIFTAELSLTSDVPPHTTISSKKASITIIDDDSMCSMLFTK